MNKHPLKDESPQMAALAAGLADGARFSRSEKFKRAQLARLQTGLGMKRLPFWRRRQALTAGVSFAALAMAAGLVLNLGRPGVKPSASQTDARARQAVQQAVTPLAVPSEDKLKPETRGAPIEARGKEENSRQEGKNRLEQDSKHPDNLRPSIERPDQDRHDSPGRESSGRSPENHSRD